jgi:hypothetical protein
VNFVANQLGPEVEALLRASARQTEAVQSEGEVVVLLDHERRRRWKLLESTGMSLEVSLSVIEGGDQALIDVRVDSTVIACVVPPWIAQRRASLTVDSQADADQRELFQRFLVKQITEPVAERRSANSRLTP